MTLEFITPFHFLMLWHCSPDISQLVHTAMPILFLQEKRAARGLNVTLFGCRSVDFKVTFERKGVLDAKQRLTRVSGDVREPFPEAVRAANVDTLVMKHFLSGFSDDDAKLILKHCSEVLPKQANILLLQVRESVHALTKNVSP